MTILTATEIIERIQQLEGATNCSVGSILPANFFESVKHHLAAYAEGGSPSAAVQVVELHQPKHRATYLTVMQQYNLNAAAFPAVEALWKHGYGVYQVGSSLLRKDWRDVDLRCIMKDEDFDKFFGKKFSPLHLFLNTAISEWIGSRSGLPIDFQFQRQTDCNKEFSTHEGHPRNAVGINFSLERQTDDRPD